MEPERGSKSTAFYDWSLFGAFFVYNPSRVHIVYIIFSEYMHQKLNQLQSIPYLYGLLGPLGRKARDCFWASLSTRTKVLEHQKAKRLR